MPPYATGADQSPYGIRTFGFKPTVPHIKGGTRYQPEDIENQHRVGVCTAISLTQNAHKALGVKFSAEFQYLCQKKYLDLNWDEGSSILNALKVAKNIGLLPETYFSYANEQDRTLPYFKYIQKLQAIPDTEIERLKTIAAQYKIKAYASVPITRDTLALAIDESKEGVLCRYTVDEAWWTQPIEPLQPPKQPISGHAITDCNYDGNSFRVANTWGALWADKGTAYRLQRQYAPTEAWIMYFSDLPPHVAAQLMTRENIGGKILDMVQKIISLLQFKK